MELNDQGNYQIVEIKAKCNDLNRVRYLLKAQEPDFKGTDHQVDTYFNVSFGRLKLREGNIENALIQYVRSDQEAPKTSCVQLYKPNPESNLKNILTQALGILTVVDKRREIYFIGNVKFHLDQVEELGTFVEIEAIDKTGNRSKSELQQQCEFYMSLLEIDNKDLVRFSYSDLLMNQP